MNRESFRYVDREGKYTFNLNESVNRHNLIMANVGSNKKIVDTA